MFQAFLKQVLYLARVNRDLPRVRGNGRRTRSLASTGYRPRLESLEDRTVLSTATHFALLAEGSAQVGSPTDIDVIALDASNHRVLNYTGTITLSSTDSATTHGSTPLPTTYTFTTRDGGAHEFQLIPGAAGTETITATDTTTSSITGSVDLTVNAAPVATHFLVEVARNAHTGVATSVEVIALDASNHVVPNYTGTVQLTSTDKSTTSGGSALPVSYTFLASDHGVHNFSITPGAVGSEILTATDTTTASITGSVTLNVTAAPVATHFVVEIARDVQSGESSPVTVVALDASNHVVRNYTGTIQLSSTDAAATLGGVVLPATYTFLSSDDGFHVFKVIFATTGSQTVTATDTTTATITGSATTLVSQPAPSWWEVAASERLNELASSIPLPS